MYIIVFFPFLFCIRTPPSLSPPNSGSPFLPASHLILPDISPLLPPVSPVPRDKRQQRYPPNPPGGSLAAGQRLLCMMTNIIRQSFVHPGGRPPAAGFSKGASQDAATQNLPLIPQQPLHGPTPLRSSPSSRLDRLKPSYSLNGPPEIGPSLWLHRSSSCGKDEAHHLPTSTCGNLAAAETVERHHWEDTKEMEPDSASAAAAPSNILQSLLGNGRLGSIREFLGEFDIFSPDRPCGGGATLTVTVASAVRLDGRQVEQIKRKMRRLTGFEDLRVVNTVDPSLIAGFVIRYGRSDDEDEEHVIDLSVKGQLADLQARIETSEKRREEQEQRWTLPG